MKKRESVKKKKEAPLTGAKKRQQVMKATAKKKKETPKVAFTFGDDESEIQIDDLTKGTPQYYGDNESYDYGWKNDNSRERDMNIPTSISHSQEMISDDVSVISMGRSIAPDDASVMSDRTDQRSRVGGYKIKKHWDDHQGGLVKKGGGLPKRDQAELQAEYDDLMGIVAERAKGNSGHKGSFPSARGAFPSSDATAVHANKNKKSTAKDKKERKVKTESNSTSMDPTEQDADTTPKHSNNGKVRPVRKNTGSTVDESQPGAYTNSPGRSVSRSGARASHQAYSMVLRAEETQVDLYGDDGGASDTVSDVIPSWYNNMARNQTGSTGQLPVAGMVDNDPSMQQAREVPESEEGSKGAPTFAALLAIVLVIGGVLLVLVLTGDSSDTTEETGTGNLRSSAPSLGPTPAPTLSAESYALTLLPEDTIREINNRPSSSQAKAYDWLVEDMNRILPDSLSDDRLIQRFAMATFFYATEGRFWNRSDDWLNHSLHECQWYSLGSFDNYIDGIIFIEVEHNSTCEVDPKEVLPNMKLQDDGILQHIWLPYNNVGGTFPPEPFELLTNLRSINLDGGHVGGTIPAELSKLTNLEALSLQANKLESTIPTTISSLMKLSMFTTAYNDLHGSLPTELGLLTDLKYLVLDTNPKMLGALPTEMFLLTDLIWFSIGKMGLTGTIPSEIALMTALDYLLVSHNLLTGKLPSEVANLQQLLGIDVSRNHFFGPIPSELGILTNVDALSMFGNHFTGTIPTELGHLTDLVALDLEDNTLMGSIPTQLGMLSNMEELWLSGNFLTGTIPTEFRNYPHLVALVLESNNLSGNIPSQLGLLSSMAVLHLQINGLTGTVPPELALLPILTAVDLRENDLIGEIPEDLCSIQTLDFNCSSSLCGCDCVCNVVLTNNTTDDGTTFTVVFDDDAVSEAAPLALASNDTTANAASQTSTSNSTSQTSNSNNTTTESATPSNEVPMNELLAGWGGSAINGTTSNSTIADDSTSDAVVSLPIAGNDTATNLPSV